MYLSTDDKVRLDEDFLTQKNSVKQEDIRFKLSWKKSKYAVTAGYDKYDWHVIYDADSSRPWEKWFVAREDAKGTEHSGYINLQLFTKSWYRNQYSLSCSTT